MGTVEGGIFGRYGCAGVDTNDKVKNVNLIRKETVILWSKNIQKFTRMTILTENINQIINLTEEEKTQISVAFKPKQLLKGDFWVKEGKVCNHVGFLVSGKLRSFYFDDAGNEITCFFVTPENFISSFTSFLTETPNVENIVAIEDALILEVSKQDLEKLSEAVPKIQILRRIIAENLYIVMEKRIAMLQSNSANQRYERMIKENPEIMMSVPLQYVASFLGITPQHFSRLRKK
jgi:CRP-like cAMP-binding protein